MFPCMAWHASGSCSTERSDQRPATTCCGSCSGSGLQLSLAWELGLRGAGTRDQHMPGSCPSTAMAFSLHLLLSPGSGKDSDIAWPEVVHLLKKFLWLISRAQLSENTKCRKAQKANTKRSVPEKKLYAAWVWIKWNYSRNPLTRHNQNQHMTQAKTQSIFNLEWRACQLFKGTYFFNPYHKFSL